MYIVQICHVCHFFHHWSLAAWRFLGLAAQLLWPSASKTWADSPSQDYEQPQILHLPSIVNQNQICCILFRSFWVIICNYMD